MSRPRSRPSKPRGRVANQDHQAAGEALGFRFARGVGWPRRWRRRPRDLRRRRCSRGARLRPTRRAPTSPSLRRAAAAEPTPSDIIERVSALKLHTVAAIHGTADGASGASLLGCRLMRLADAKAKCGLPEVHLGIDPGETRLAVRADRRLRGGDQADDARPPRGAAAAASHRPRRRGGGRPETAKLLTPPRLSSARSTSPQCQGRRGRASSRRSLRVERAACGGAGAKNEIHAATKAMVRRPRAARWRARRSSTRWRRRRRSRASRRGSTRSAASSSLVPPAVSVRALQHVFKPSVRWGRSRGWTRR